MREFKAVLTEDKRRGAKTGRITSKQTINNSYSVLKAVLWNTASKLYISFISISYKDHVKLW